MLERILEPEVMDTREEAVDYDSMDHSTVNRTFVDDLLAALTSREKPLKILDVGTGTAQIPIEFCSRGIECRIDAIDLSEQMLIVGRENVRTSGLIDSIVLTKIDAKTMPFDEGCFDIVMSNSIIHHIPNPVSSLSEMKRVLRCGGLLFVRDLLRADSIEAVDQLVDTYAADENDHQRQMFRDSLRAALSLDEARQMLEECGLPRDWVTQTTDRHWTICGVLGTDC